VGFLPDFENQPQTLFAWLQVRGIRGTVLPQFIVCGCLGVISRFATVFPSKA
jgi:hypothetical protein